jgi:hypothetical protein
LKGSIIKNLASHDGQQADIEKAIQWKKRKKERKWAAEG